MRTVLDVNDMGILQSEVHQLNDVRLRGGWETLAWRKLYGNVRIVIEPGSDADTIVGNVKVP